MDKVAMRPAPRVVLPAVYSAGLKITEAQWAAFKAEETALKKNANATLADWDGYGASVQTALKAAAQ